MFKIFMVALIMLWVVFPTVEWIITKCIVMFSPKKVFRKNADGRIISANDNLAAMNPADMIQYDLESNVPFLLTSFGGMVINGLYTTGHTFVVTVWYFGQLVLFPVVLIYRSVVVPRNARRFIAEEVARVNGMKKAKKKK